MKGEELKVRLAELSGILSGRLDDRGQGCDEYSKSEGLKEKSEE